LPTRMSSPAFKLAKQGVIRSDNDGIIGSFPTSDRLPRAGLRKEPGGARRHFERLGDMGDRARAGLRC